jgi:hypothetical protein
MRRWAGREQGARAGVFVGGRGGWGQGRKVGARTNHTNAHSQAPTLLLLMSMCTTFCRRGRGAGTAVGHRPEVLSVSPQPRSSSKACDQTTAACRAGAGLPMGRAAAGGRRGRAAQAGERRRQAGSSARGRAGGSGAAAFGAAGACWPARATLHNFEGPLHDFLPSLRCGLPWSAGS